MRQDVPSSPPPTGSLRQYRFQGFILCPASRSLRRNGTASRLRPKTFDTLLYLIENRQRVVTKDELIEHVWKGIAVTDDVLVGCIHEIRRAVGDHSKQGQIVRTFPKLGYRFVAPVVELEATGVEARHARLPKRKLAASLLVAATAIILVLGLLMAWLLRPRPQTEVGWWRFAENGGTQVLYSSGKGNNGRIVGALERTRGFGSAPALRFDGTGYVIGDSPGAGFPVGDQSFTITAWMRTTDLPKGAPSPIFHFGTSGWEPRSNAYLDLAVSGAACFGWRNGYEYICGWRPLTADVWHHVAGTYSRHQQTRVLHVDGAECARGVVKQPSTLGNGTPWLIGAYQSGGDAYVGLLQDVRLYNGDLSHPQIGALRDCSLSDSVSLPRLGSGYFVPLYRATVERRAGEAGFVYSGFGSGGVEFAVSDGACSLASLLGAALPHDLRIGMEIQLPAGMQGGPFFCARRVRPGDPIEGRGFGGCWLRLHATGEVTVHRLDHSEKEQVEPLASGVSPVPVAPAEWHRLEAELRGHRLQAWVDGTLVRFQGERAAGDAVSLDGLVLERAAGVGVVAPPVPADWILVRKLEVSEPESQSSKDSRH